MNKRKNYEALQQAFAAAMEARVGRDRLKMMRLSHPQAAADIDALLVENSELVITLYDSVFTRLLGMDELKGLVQSEIARKPRKPRRSRKLTSEVKKLWNEFHQRGREEHERAALIRKRITYDGTGEWRNGPNGQPVTIKTIRDIIHDEGLRKANR